MATANYGRAIAWFELVIPQLAEVFGPGHALTRAATEAVTGARLMVGGPRSEARLLANIVTADQKNLDPHDPQLPRNRAALGLALLAGGDIADAIETLARAVDAAISALGRSHPDTKVYRKALAEACDVATARGRKRDLRAVAGARPLLAAEDTPSRT